MADANNIALTGAEPGDREKGVAIAVVVISLCTLIAMTPFAAFPLGRVDAFLPAYESALLINDSITAVLLFGQFSRVRSWALLVLSCGYLFDASIILPHAMTFPGVFAPRGLLGAGPQTTAWLYCFWHGGFALFIVAYAVLARRGVQKHQVNGAIMAVALAVAGTVALVTILAWIAINGQKYLTPIMDGADYSMLVTKGISPAICLCSAAAILLLWPRRKSSTLDLWLLVVMFTWLCDVVLSAVVGSSRFDLGWYGGRTFGLVAASFLLVTLLVELNRLYASLGDALEIAEARNVQLAASRDKLAHSQRLEAMGQMTGGVAHDFNNLLMVVTAGFEMIRRSLSNPDKIDKLARAGLDATARGKKLTQQLLTFARKQVSRPITLNLNHLIADLEPLLGRAVGSNIEIRARLSAVLDPAHVDRSQFEAALLNLVVNARDAMANGGSILIETTNRELDAEAGARENISPGPYVVISVSDTGLGMTPDVIAKAFDPFFTTKEVGQGSGLGLSQVYGFARSAGGYVNITSKPEVGTDVKIYLPKSSDVPYTHPLPHSSLPIRHAKGDECVLVVEDDEDVLRHAVDGLQELGYTVKHATNASEALEIIRDDNRIDVLFSDVIMPGGMNGAQLAVQARRLRPDIKILLTSGYTAEALADEHAIPHDLELLNKPYLHAELAHKLRLIISRN